MLKSKSSRILLISILTVLLSYNVVYACSPIEPTIFVKCSNLEVSIVANRTPTEGDTYESVQERWVNDTIKNLYAIVPECAEDLTPILDSFEQEIVKWLDYKNKRGAFLDGDLILEPYSAGKDSELQTNKNSLLSCGYAEYKHIGNWLIIFETSRPYCHTFWFAGGMCPSIIFSLGHFFFYLVTNFSLTTLPHFRIIPNSYAVLALGSNHWMGFIYRCFGFMVQILEKWRVRFQSKNGLTKRAPDAGDSAHIPNSFTRLSLFLAGRLRRPRPSAGNANRWAFGCSHN